MVIVGVVFKIKSQHFQGFFRHCHLFLLRHQVSYDLPVLPENIIDRSYNIVGITVLPVIISVAATIITKLLVTAAMDRFMAFQAQFLPHKTKVNRGREFYKYHNAVFQAELSKFEA